MEKKNIGKAFRYYHFEELKRYEECNICVPLKFKLNIKEPFQYKLNDNEEELLNYNIGDDITLDSDYIILEGIN